MVDDACYQSGRNFLGNLEMCREPIRTIFFFLFSKRSSFRTEIISRNTARFRDPKAYGLRIDHDCMTLYFKKISVGNSESDSEGTPIIVTFLSPVQQHGKDLRLLH